MFIIIKCKVFTNRFYKQCLSLILTQRNFSLNKIILHIDMYDHNRFHLLFFVVSNCKFIYSERVQKKNRYKKLIPR